MQTLRDIPIQKKFARIIFGATGVALFTAILFILVYESVTFRPRLVQDLKSLVDLYSVTMSASLDFNDSISALENLSTLKSQSEISTACVYKTDKSVFAKYSRAGMEAEFCPPITLDQQMHRFEREHLLLFNPIRYKGELAGYFFIKYDFPSFLSRLFQYGTLGFVVLLSLLVTTWLLTRRVARNITAPILELEAIAESISTRRDYSLRTVAHGQDEVGHLANSFNLMLDTVERHSNSLKSAERRSAFLAEASAILFESSDSKTVITRFGKLCVRDLCEWCLVDLIEGHSIRRLVGAHRNPEKEAMILELSQRFPIDLNSKHPGAEVIRTQRPILLPHLTETDIRTYCINNKHTDLIRALGTQSFIAVPLSVRGICIGAFSLGTGEPGKEYGHADLELALELARRLAIAIDSAQKKEDVEESVSRLNATLEATADGILVIDRAEKCTSFNNKFASMWNVPEEIRNKPEENIVIPYLLAQVKEPELFKKRDPEIEIELKDGRTFEQSSQPQIIGENNMGRVFSFRDVTEKKKNQYNERFLAKASVALFSSLDLTSTLNALCHLVTPEIADCCSVDLLGENNSLQYIQLAHPDTVHPSETLTLRERIAYDMGFDVGISAILRGGKSEKYLNPTASLLEKILPSEGCWNLLKKAPISSVMLVPLTIRGKTQGAVTFVSTDVHHRYTDDDLEFAEELCFRAALAIDNAHLYDEAQRSIKVREDFMSIAAHELRTPLTPLKMQLDILKTLLRKEPVLSLRFQEFMKLIDGSDQHIFRLTRLVEDLLDVSQMSSGRMTLFRETVNLSGLVREVTDRYQSELKKAKCEVTLEIAPDIIGFWDRLRLEQVVINLLTNVIKYGAGKPAKIQLSAEDSRAILSFRDQGIGISEADQKRIFGRFERAVSIKNFGGFGLGLYIVQKIVDGHGGTIKVNSELGAGSTFVVELPLGKPTS